MTDGPVPNSRAILRGDGAIDTPLEKKDLRQASFGAEGRWSVPPVEVMPSKRMLPMHHLRGVDGRHPDMLVALQDVAHECNGTSGASPWASPRSDVATEAPPCELACLGVDTCPMP